MLLAVFVERGEEGEEEEEELRDVDISHSSAARLSGPVAGCLSARSVSEDRTSVVPSLVECQCFVHR